MPPSLGRRSDNLEPAAMEGVYLALLCAYCIYIRHCAAHSKLPPKRPRAPGCLLGNGPSRRGKGTGPSGPHPQTPRPGMSSPRVLPPTVPQMPSQETADRHRHM